MREGILCVRVDVREAVIWCMGVGVGVKADRGQDENNLYLCL